ncbi:hypothetical protein L2K70_14190 [Nocardioides KLBMP 9356]|uniref:MFS transporter n=1 Tax=Nocardioides potassii TaxID=2911371 RepID=A0ABS9HC32_9ACTN|nr:hypothetical protein [Nocardioides potassii]MCF6378760.1 hypothetical protein [Nocardioides potassii]
MAGSRDAVARGRFALVVALLGVASALTAVAVAPTMATQAVVVLAAVSAAAGLAGVQSLLAVPGTRVHSLWPPRRSAAVPLVLAGRCTDTVRHPVRPRAPGRA